MLKGTEHIKKYIKGISEANYAIHSRKEITQVITGEMFPQEKRQL